MSSTTSRVGNYPFYSHADDNPVLQSAWNSSQNWGGGSQVFKLSHTYCDRAYWLLKWNVSGGFDLSPPSITVHPPIENPDTDADAIVEVPSDMTSLGADSGSIALTPQDDQPCVLLPLAAPPLWYAGLFAHAYLSQGAFTNLPYHYLSETYDQDGYYTAFSLKTRVEESGILTNSTTHIKQVEVVRPRGNVVIFDFSWNGSAFSAKGYPIGVNKRRSYVLMDRTPTVHTDKAYDLYFASGIIHSFGDDGELERVKRQDGLEVDPSGGDTDVSIDWDDGQDDGPASASDDRYDVTITWDRGKVKTVEYDNGSGVNTVTLGYDAKQFVNKLNKSLFPETAPTLNANRDEVTLGSGVKVKRTATGTAGSSRTVTLTRTVPGLGGATFITEFNGSDRVTKTDLSSGSGSAVTQYQYQPGGLTRYDNGLLKEARVKEAKYPNGATETYTYTAGEGWLASASMDIGSGLTRKTVCEYTPANSGDAANPTNLVERPRKVETQLSGTAVGCALFSYGGAGSVKSERCAFSGAAWGTAVNLRYESTFETAGLSAGLPLTSSSPLGSDTYAQTPSDGLLHTEKAHFDGRTFITEVNAFGNAELQKTTESGVVTDSIQSDTDDYGRPTTTTYQDGSTTVAAYSTVNGPDSIQNVDASSSSCDYYPNGLIKHFVDGSTGITTDYAYDPLGQCTKMTRSSGGASESESYQHDALGRLLKYTDVRGGVTAYSPGFAGGFLRTTISPATGGTLIEEYYADGQLRSVTGSAAAHPVIRDRFISGGYCEKEINAGNPFEYVTTTFSFLGMPVSVRHSGVSGLTTLTADAAGRLTEADDECGIKEIAQYNANNWIAKSGTKCADAGDRVIDYQRSVSGAGINQNWQTYPSSGSSPATVVGIRPSLDTKSGAFTIMGRSGNYARTSFSGTGNYTCTINNPDGSQETRQYDRWLLKESQVTASGTLLKQTEYKYDGLGYIKQATVHLPSSTAYIHYYRDSLNRIKSIFGPDPAKGPTYISYYGNSTRVQHIVRSDGSVVYYTYNDAGRILSEHDSGGYDNDFRYDSMGRCTIMNTWQEGVLRTTSWDYDNATGLPKTKKINGDVVESYSQRANGQVETIADANGVVATATYDDGGALNQVSHSDGITATITHSYGRMGELCSIGQAGGISESYSRTVDGLPVADSVRGGGVVSDALFNYGYSANGLLSRVGTITGLGARSLGVAYDGAARVSSISEGTHNATYGYDWGTLVSGVSISNSTSGVGLQKTTSWDYLNQRPLSIQYTVGTNFVASYAYQYITNDDRIARITLADGSSWRYQYDAKGHLTSGKRYFADGSDWFGRQFAYTYDSLGNTLKAGPLTASGTPRYSFTSGYPSSAYGFILHAQRQWSNVIEVSGSAATGTTVVVNRTPAQRKDKYFWAAITVPNTSSAVDQEVKIWVARTNAPGDLVGCVSGRVEVAQAVETPTYDAKSSLLSDSRRQFTYNARGWMCEALNTAVSPQMRVSFDYYPDGRRARKTVYHVGGMGWMAAEAHQYYYDGWNMVAEAITNWSVSPAQSLARYYTWGLDLAGQRQGRFGQVSGGIGGLLAITEVEGGATKVYYPVVDHNGNIHKLVDGQTGAVVAEYEYDPFGVLLSKTGAKSGSCPFRFMSKYYDAELGLYYFGYRYYDPMTTKWLTLDPLGEQGGLNLTAFCRNDPINNVDPLGLYDVAGTDSSGNSIRADDPEFLRMESVRELESQRRNNLRTAEEVLGAGAFIVPAVGSIALTAPESVLLSASVGVYHGVLVPLASAVARSPWAIRTAILMFTGYEATPQGRQATVQTAVSAEEKIAAWRARYAASCGGSIQIGPSKVVKESVISIVKSGDVVTYRPTIPGFENHHGVLDVWATHNVPGYVSRAPGGVTVALTLEEHEATKVAYRQWLEMLTGRPVGGRVDWTKLGPREAKDVAERMFDAANVSEEMRQNFYSAFTRYIYGLE